jgi:tRNA nucleotidyltransferase (CCA-adding enzyme)
MNATDPVSRMQQTWPGGLLSLITRAGEASRSQGDNLYLVGGAVRDLLLGRPSTDLDLVVEGDAVGLARMLAPNFTGRFVAHPRFGTATFKQGGWSLDLVSARSETYLRPGALPVVRPGSIREDLLRRDFSINAMAVRLSPNPQTPGSLLDPCRGRDDLEGRLIRILHPSSFTDDATRILRALRYEQRLNFKLETGTRKLLRRDRGMLDRISGDRIRHEIEMILREERPEMVLGRAFKLGVLGPLSPSLRGNGWLSGRFQRVRRLKLHPASQTAIYLCLLLYPPDWEEVERLISRLTPPKALAQTLRDSQRLKTNLGPLSPPGLPPSRLYRHLQGYSPDAVQAVAIAEGQGPVSRALELFLRKLRYVESPLNGEAVIGLGASPGADLGRMLDALLDAKLEGRIMTRADAESLVSRWLKDVSYTSE